MQDELAAGSHYEAALYDDPAIDVEEYYSDWEYYSDDYYDDDSTVRQSTLRAKSEPTPKSRRHLGARAPRKVHKQPSPLKIDTTAFQGVVWRTTALDKDQELAVQIYQPGHGDKVALLKNWREIFKSVQPALDKSSLRKRKARGSRISGVSDADGSDADDEVVQDADEPGQNSDDMSDVQSTDQTESVDAGDASNTTPELGQSPDEIIGDLKKAVGSAKRGRKRKAEVASPDTKKSVPAGSTPRSRSKRVALDSGPEESEKSSSGPVRRSARQKK